MDLLYSLDCALDAAGADGRFAVARTDPGVRETLRWLRLMDAPLHVPPRPPDPIMTAVLVMSYETLRELVRVRRATCALGEYLTYAGVPIKIDEDAGDRIHLVSLRQMGGAS